MNTTMIDVLWLCDVFSFPILLIIVNMTTIMLITIIGLNKHNGKVISDVSHAYVDI